MSAANETIDGLQYAHDVFREMLAVATISLAAIRLWL